MLIIEFRDLNKIIADHKEEDVDDNQSDEDSSEVPFARIPTLNDVLDAVFLFCQYLTAAPTDTEQVDRCYNRIENFIISRSLASLGQIQV